MTKITEIKAGTGQVEVVAEALRGTIGIPYVIVRQIEVCGQWTAGCVYGPYDQQGASAAYRKLVAADLNGPNAKLEVRGLFPTGDTR